MKRQEDAAVRAESDEDLQDRHGACHPDWRLLALMFPQQFSAQVISAESLLSDWAGLLQLPSEHFVFAYPAAISGVKSSITTNEGARCLPHVRQRVIGMSEGYETEQVGRVHYASWNRF